MRLVPEMTVALANIGSRVANTGASFAVGVAYLLFGLMLLTMFGEMAILIVRAYN